MGSTHCGSGLGSDAPHNTAAVPTPRLCFLPPLPSRSSWELQVFTCRRAACWFAPAQAACTVRWNWPCPEGRCLQFVNGMLNLEMGGWEHAVCALLI